VVEFFGISGHPGTVPLLAQPPGEAPPDTQARDAQAVSSMVELLQAQTARLASMEMELEAAKRALHERKIIERAKGVLMSRMGLSEEAAFRALQKTAMDQNRRLLDVAEATLSLPDLAFAGRGPGGGLKPAPAGPPFGTRRAYSHAIKLTAA
jgi:soluble lytic murein transglycosylase-like protein